LKTLRNILPASNFYKNISILTLGNVLSNLITAIALIILARIYTPEDFGVASVYVSIISIAIVISSLRLNMAIPLPNSEEDAKQLLILSFIFSLLISIFVSIFIFIFPDQFLVLINQPDLSEFLWLIPLGIFLGSIYNVLQFWATRKKRFKDISITNITRSTFGSLIQVIVGLFILGPFGLILGHFAYAFFGSFRLAIPLFSKDNFFNTTYSFKNTTRVLKDYKKFPIFSFPESLFNTSSQYIPLIIIASFIKIEAGFLFIAIRLMSLPVTLIGKSISQVYLSEAKTKIHNGEIYNFTISLIKKIAVFAVPLFLIIAAISPFIFGTILGDQWSRVGIIIAMIAPWHLLQIIVSPISTVLHVTNNQQIALNIQIIGFVLRVGAIVLGMMYFSEYLTEILALSSAFFYLFYLIYLINFTQKQKNF